MALISYAADFANGYRARFGKFALRAHRGQVEQPTKFDLVINLKTAKALGPIGCTADKSRAGS
jgi:hypothetical protein